MNKLTKVGFSALCGSLAAISTAKAGDLTVTGGVDMSWISKSEAVVGNPIGMGSNLTFKGAGELDNGWSFDLTVAHLNGAAYSSAVASITMGGLGKLTVNQGDSTSGLDAFDDKMPTAWEEPWGAGLSTGLATVVGTGKSMSIQYTTPKILGMTLVGATAHAAGVTDTADKGFSGTSTGSGQIYDLTLNINPSFGTEVLSGLNIFAGGSMTEKHKTELTEIGVNTSDDSDAQYEAAGGITYDIGPISLGYGAQGQLTGKTTTATDVDYYRNKHWGVAVNINDSLSVSYGYHTSYQGLVNPGVSATDELVVSSAQIAYTMGGASVRIADVNADNVDYSAGTDRGATILSVSLAF